MHNYFGISTPQASGDISLYQELAPLNCEYDRTAKAYVPSEHFAPHFEHPNPQTYLNELRSLKSGLTTRNESWIGVLPSFETVPYPKRSVDPETLRKILRAIHAQDALETRYQSLSRLHPIWRWITPHALGYDGHRWHARAFCHIRGEFRDFVLGRILKLRRCRSHQIDTEADREWSEYVTLVIGTHPGLPREQRRAVELDYGMKRGRLEVRIRAALVHYMKRWMRLDLNADAVRPEQQQIVLVNDDEVNTRTMALARESNEHIERRAVPRFTSSDSIAPKP